MDLLRQVKRRRRLNLHPCESLHRAFCATRRRVHPSAPARQEQPLSAAVEGVTEIAADPAAWGLQLVVDPACRLDEEGVVHCDHAQRERELQEGRVDGRRRIVLDEAAVADEVPEQEVLEPFRRLRKGGVIEETGGGRQAGDARAQRRRVAAFDGLLPADVAGRVPDCLQVACHESHRGPLPGGRGAPLVTQVRGERPEPDAVTIELEVGLTRKQGGGRILHSRSAERATGASDDAMARQDLRRVSFRPHFA